MDAAFVTRRRNQGDVRDTGDLGRYGGHDDRVEGSGAEAPGTQIPTRSMGV